MAEITTRVPLYQRGDRGAEVRLVQQALTGAGALAAGEVDGVFGPRTEAAVRSFQAARGLPADGVVWLDTFEALVPFAGAKAPELAKTVAPREDPVTGQVSVVRVPSGPPWWVWAAGGATLLGLGWFLLAERGERALADYD